MTSQTSLGKWVRISALSLCLLVPAFPIGAATEKESDAPSTSDDNLSLSLSDICNPQKGLMSDEVKNRYTNIKSDLCKGVPNGTASACAATYVQTRESYRRYSGEITRICAELTEENKKIKEEKLNQVDTQKKNIEFGDLQIKSVEQLIRVNSEEVLKLSQRVKANGQRIQTLAGSKMSKPSKDTLGKLMAAPEKQDPFLDGSKITAEIDTNLIKNPAFASNTEVKANAASASFGGSLISELLADRSQREAAIVAFKKLREQGNQNVNNSAPPPGSSPGAFGGLNPASLLGLGSALAGLAQKKSGSEDDSLSGLSSAETNRPEVKVNDLGGGSTAGTNRVGFSSSPPKESNTENPGSEGYGSYGGFDSEVSSGRSPSSSGAGGAATTGVSGTSGGGSGDPEEAAAEEAAAKAAEVPNPTADESLSQFGGGLAAFGGANGSAGGGDMMMGSSPETGMNDLFTDIEKSVEGENSDSNLFGSPDGEDTIGAEDSEGLFPRVRACYVRSLKKGLVLNGVREKVY